MDTLDILRAKYTEYNTAYFGGKLPTVPIRWGKLKYATAHVGFQAIGIKGGMKRFHGGMEMVFSDKYNRPAETLFPVLLHEMIHVYIIRILDDIHDDHGPVFRKLRTELSAKSGIDIPMTDKAADYDLKVQIKPVYVAIKYYPNTTVYALVSKKAAENTANLPLTFVHDDAEVREITSELWTKKAASSRIQRDINRRTGYFIAKPHDMDDLFANSRLLWTNRVIKESIDNTEIIYRLLTGKELYAEYQRDNSIADRIKYIDISSLTPSWRNTTPQYGICAFSGNKIVGIAGLQISPHDPNIVWAIYTSVDPEYRQRGIAKQLIRERNRYCRENNLTLERSSYTRDGEAYLKPFIDRGGDLEEAVAYHGSARDFDNFDGSFVGTGDGALTFGWGIYLAGSKKVASIFRKRGTGKMFTVDLPDEDHFLLWDKTYDDQSPYVRSALEKMNISRIYQYCIDKEYIHPQDYHTDTGEDIYGVIASAVPFNMSKAVNGNDYERDYLAYKKRASLWLLHYGIAGIRYRDVINGDADNFVVFDPNLIKIKSKK